MFRIILISVMLFSHMVYAVQDHNYEISLGLSLLDMNYKEFKDNGFLLDREDGLLPGMTGQLTYYGKNLDSVFLASYHASDIHYDGHTQPGLLPVQTRTDTDIVDIQYRLSEKAIEPYRFYGGLGYRYWRRSIRPTIVDNGGVPEAVAGLLEHYDWFYGMLGVNSSFYKKGNSELAFDFRVTHMLKANMEIDFLGYNGYDNKTLDLGKKTNIRIALPWRFKSEKSSVWLIEPYFEQWDIGKSNTVNLTVNGSVVTGCPGSTPCGVLEPRSETRNLGINAQMIIPF